jgi:hypothetical protein
VPVGPVTERLVRFNVLFELGEAASAGLLVDLP